MSTSRRPSGYVVATLVVITTLAALATPARPQAAPRGVVLLYSYEREFSHFAFARLFRPQLTRTSPDPIDFLELSIQSVRKTATRNLRRRRSRDGILSIDAAGDPRSCASPAELIAR